MPETTEILAASHLICTVRGWLVGLDGQPSGSSHLQAHVLERKLLPQVFKESRIALLSTAGNRGIYHLLCTAYGFEIQLLNTLSTRGHRQGYPKVEGVLVDI